MKRAVYALSFALSIAATLSAQETSRFTFQLGTGFTQPVGNSGRHLDTGWTITGGGGVNFGPYVGMLIDLGYTDLGINSGTLSNIGVPGGDVSVFSATLDPIIHVAPHSHVDFYLTGGGGLFRRNQEFTQQGVGTVLGFDPFFGFYPAAIPTTQILASYSVNKPGIDVGAGFAVGTKWHGKFYAEAKYNRIFYGSDRHTDYLPVTFGFRW